MWTFIGFVQIHVRASSLKFYWNSSKSLKVFWSPLKSWSQVCTQIQMYPIFFNSFPTSTILRIFLHFPVDKVQFLFEPAPVGTVKLAQNVNLISAHALSYLYFYLLNFSTIIWSIWELQLYDSFSAPHWKPSWSMLSFATLLGPSMRIILNSATLELQLCFSVSAIHEFGESVMLMIIIYNYYQW